MNLRHKASILSLARINFTKKNPSLYPSIALLEIVFRNTLKTWEYFAGFDAQRSKISSSLFLLVMSPVNRIIKFCLKIDLFMTPKAHFTKSIWVWFKSTIVFTEKTRENGFQLTHPPPSLSAAFFFTNKKWSSSSSSTKRSNSSFIMSTKIVSPDSLLISHSQCLNLTEFFSPKNRLTIYFDYIE